MIIACPICGDKNYQVRYHNLAVSDAMIVKCSHCGHFYTWSNNYFDEVKLYSEKVYKISDTRHSIFDKILDWECNKIIRKIDQLKANKGSLVDFGAGKGKFASVALRNGWKVKCVETARERAEFAEHIYGLEVNENLYVSGRIFQNDFDVLVMLHVLEHLRQPKNILRELIRANVKAKGLIVIEVPNFNSLQSKIAGKNWMHLDVPRHINHFTADQLETMAKELGLVPAATNHFSFHLGVLGMIDSFLKLFGYRKNLIYDLKNKKKFEIKVAIILLLPFAILIELFAAIVGQGGIIRKYFILR